MNHHATISLLKPLIAASSNGEYVFRSAAKRARSNQLALIFDCLADDCLQGANELQRCVVRLGGPMVVRGATVKLWCRAALGAHRMLAGSGDQALLEVCRRIQAQALLNYREALGESLPATVGALVERQYRGARINAVRIRDLLVMYQTIGAASDNYGSNIVALRRSQGVIAGLGQHGADLAQSQRNRNIA